MASCCGAHWGENRFRITDWLLSKPDRHNPNYS